MPTYWQQRLLSAVRETVRQRRLEQMFDASGCREGWLQGELYLRCSANHALSVNTIPLANNAKADLAADLEIEGGAVRRCGLRPMVGEIKMLASSFQEKTITGGALKPFLGIEKVRQRRAVSFATAKRLAGTWGIVPDYVRLASAQGLPPETERVLVLVAFTAVPEDRDRIGDALESIRFADARENSCALGDWGFARAWSF